MNEKPSRNEDEYFVRQDADLIRQLREQRDAERARTGEDQRTIACPRCAVTLEQRSMESVLVDVCPMCGGVWLDAGELDILRKARGSRSFLDTLLGREP